MTSRTIQTTPKLAELSVASLAGLCAQLVLVCAVLHEGARPQEFSAASVLGVTAVGTGLLFYWALVTICLFGPEHRRQGQQRDNQSRRQPA